VRALVAKFLQQERVNKFKGSTVQYSSWWTRPGPSADVSFKVLAMELGTGVA